MNSDDVDALAASATQEAAAAAGAAAAALAASSFDVDDDVDETRRLARGVRAVAVDDHGAGCAMHAD